jgi:hypothetical protein
VTSGLRERPGVPDDVRQAIDAAIEQLIATAPSATAAPATWRFSGRWYSAHPIRGRSRPR